MKKLPFILLLLSLKISAQEDARWLNEATLVEKGIAQMSIYQVDSASESVFIEWWFDKQGRIKKVFANGVFQDSSIHIYNTMGKDSVIMEYELGGFDARSEYHYNAKGLKESEKVYKENNGKLNLDAEDKFSYDAMNNEISCQHIEKGDNWKSKTVHSYKDGKLMETTTTTSNSNEIVKTYYQYTDTSTTVTEETSANNKIVRRSINIYDTLGNRTSEKSFYADDSKPLQLYSEEKYLFRNNKLVWVESRYIDQNNVERIYNYEVRDGLIMKTPRKKSYTEFRYVYWK